MEWCPILWPCYNLSRLSILYEWGGEIWLASNYRDAYAVSTSGTKKYLDNLRRKDDTPPA